MPVTIPGSLATLRVPLDSLRRLPQGAAYRSRQGHATATVAVDGEMLDVSASCDSLQAVVAGLREELKVAQASSADKAETTGRSPLRTRMAYLAAGIVAGLILSTIIKKRK